MADQHVIFLEFPLVFGLVGVEMVEPSLPALLGCAEVFSVGGDIQLFG
jgi:hypothetical protein